MKVKFSRCTSSNLANVPKVDGQLIYTTDTGEVYLDVGNTRNIMANALILPVDIMSLTPETSQSTVDNILGSRLDKIESCMSRGIVVYLVGGVLNDDYYNLVCSYKYDLSRDDQHRIVELIIYGTSIRKIVFTYDYNVSGSLSNPKIISNEVIIGDDEVVIVPEAVFDIQPDSSTQSIISAFNGEQNLRKVISHMENTKPLYAYAGDMLVSVSYEFNENNYFSISTVRFGDEYLYARFNYSIDSNNELNIEVGDMIYMTTMLHNFFAGNIFSLDETSTTEDILAELNMQNEMAFNSSIELLRSGYSVALGPINNYLVPLGINFEDGETEDNLPYTDVTFMGNSDKVIGTITMRYMLNDMDELELSIVNKEVYTLVDDTDVLTKNNTSAYTPLQDYNPATKKYVDDQVGSINTILDNINGEVV